MSADEVPVSDTLTPLEEAERTLERIAWHKKNLDHHRRLAAQREAEISERITYNEALLKGLAWKLKQEYGKAETPLPGGGSVRIAKATGSFEVTDSKAAVAFARATDCLHAKTEYVYYKKDLRAKLKETDDGLCDPATGEVVTWARIERPADGLSLSYTLPGKEASGE